VVPPALSPKFPPKQPLLFPPPGWPSFPRHICAMAMFPLRFFPGCVGSPPENFFSIPFPLFSVSFLPTNRITGDEFLSHETAHPSLTPSWNYLLLFPPKSLPETPLCFSHVIAYEIPSLFLPSLQETFPFAYCVPPAGPMMIFFRRKHGHSRYRILPGFPPRLVGFSVHLRSFFSCRSFPTSSTFLLRCSPTVIRCYSPLFSFSSSEHKPLLDSSGAGMAAETRVSTDLHPSPSTEILAAHNESFRAVTPHPWNLIQRFLSNSQTLTDPSLSIFWARSAGKKMKPCAAL